MHREGAISASQSNRRYSQSSRRYSRGLDLPLLYRETAEHRSSILPMDRSGISTDACFMGRQYSPTEPGGESCLCHGYARNIAIVLSRLIPLKL